jgi:two-component system response regulator NreC
MSENDKIRVVLADDHAVLRAGLKALIEDEPDIDVVGEASNGAEALEVVKRERPDVVVMDIAMPVMNGLEATERIGEMNLGSKVLVLTMHAEEQYLFQVLQAGGSGYVLKQSADSELMDAIRSVHRGEAFLYPSGVRLLLQAYLKGDKPAGGKAEHSRLSDREEQVLALTAEGYSNQEIADRLYLSSKTVDTYRQRIMEKLDLHHRSELVRYALDRGLLKARE